MQKVFECLGLQELDKVADYLLDQVGEVLLFEGHLGAGKTTLIKQMAKKLGVTTTASSPTFSIVNEYQTPQNHTVYHLDLYRMENPMELIEIGLEEYLIRGKHCWIEWPEIATKLLKSYPCTKVNIKWESELLRSFEIKKLW